VGAFALAVALRGFFAGWVGGQYLAGGAGESGATDTCGFPPQPYKSRRCCGTSAPRGAPLAWGGIGGRSWAGGFALAVALRFFFAGWVGGPCLADRISRFFGGGFFACFKSD
jgi:hypothetical protein